MSDTKISLVISWLVISTVIAFMLITSAVYQNAASIRFIPTSLCKLGSHCPCPLCGMTKAFILIAHGRISDALTLNGLALPIFIACVLNEMIMVIFIRSHYSRLLLQGLQEKRTTKTIKRKEQK